MSEDDLLSMQQAAQLLGVSMPAFYAIVRRNELSATETRWLGQQRRRFFRRGEVEALRRRRAGEAEQT